MSPVLAGMDNVMLVVLLADNLLELVYDIEEKSVNE